MKYVSRGLCVVVPFLTYSFPSGLFVYWITNNLLSLLQGYILNLRKVMQFFRIKRIDQKELEEIEYSLRMNELKKARRRPSPRAVSLSKNITYIDDLKAASKRRKLSNLNERKRSRI